MGYSEVMTQQQIESSGPEGINPGFYYLAPIYYWTFN